MLLMIQVDIMERFLVFEPSWPGLSQDPWPMTHVACFDRLGQKGESAGNGSLFSFFWHR